MSEFWHAITSFFEQNQVAFRIFLIIVGAIVLRMVVRMAIRRTVNRIVHGVKKSQATDSTTEISTSGVARQRAIQRARTLGAVARSVVTWVIFVITLALILHQFNIDLTGVLASAGFIGAALAFGAQSIVKDVLNGIFMVFEDQIGVGDHVKVGSVEGTVEDVGIRVTQVRGLDGTLWFVRNGEILELGNSSQGHGQAIIDITVLNNNNLDAVQDAALAAANKVLKQQEYRRKITDAPKMWGVQSIYGDRATIRFTIRTRAEAQWAVQRAVRRQIQIDFAELGIELATQLPGIPSSV
ncbi:MAG: mechanosensitive ion channel family protein [Microbacteriaceae bacterium]|nr:mechanosensitive ion channel family protein [Microbacteriaceae bacterium]